MYQNYPNYYQTAQPQQQPASRMPIGLKGRPVSSLDEVRGTTIDFDGSIFFFPDLANKRIYTKQINVDGTAQLNMYELKNLPMETNNANYVTREEFDMTMNQIKALLAQTVQPAQQQPQTNVEPPNIASQF